MNDSDKLKVKRDYCLENGISRRMKTISRGRYVITLVANRDDSANLNHDMYIQYTDEAGGITLIKDKPKYHQWPHVNTQLAYTESYMNCLMAGVSDKSKAIREFLNTTPNLSLSEVSVEAGFNPGYLDYFRNSKMRLTVQIVDSLTLHLKKYGFIG